MSPWKWRFCWLAVFAVNLVVPLALSGTFTEHGGKGGVYVAIFALWLWPSWLGERSRAFASAMVTGGLVVGLSQFLPILQFGAGFIALAIADPSGARDGAGYHADYLGFVATLITGLILQTTALAVGQILYLCGDRTLEYLCGDMKSQSVLSLRVNEPMPRAVAAQFDPEMDSH